MMETAPHEILGALLEAQGLARNEIGSSAICILARADRSRAQRWQRTVEARGNCPHEFRLGKGDLPVGRHTRDRSFQKPLLNGRRTLRKFIEHRIDQMERTVVPIEHFG